MARGLNSKKARRRRENAFREQDGLCWYCKQPMVIRVLEPGTRPPDDTCTLEHLRPRGHPDRRPSDYKANVAACWLCNQVEGQKHSAELDARGYNRQLHPNPPLSIIGGLMKACVMSSFLLGGCSVTRYTENGEVTTTVGCKKIEDGRWRCSGRRLLWIEWRIK